MNPREQHNALLRALKAAFGVVEVENRLFQWLIVPSVSQLQEPLSEVYDALSRYRGCAVFTKAGRQLACDYVVPSRHLIIEYDERQHFSMPRAVAIRLNPKALPLLFDSGQWIRYCEEIRAVDTSPPYRDEQRAFYDSMRDLLAPEHGYRVKRLKDGAFDWTRPDAGDEINRWRV